MSEDIIGIVGVSMILVGYFLLQSEKIDAKGLIYSLINLLGAVLILYSLFFNWNLPSVVIEVFWIIISVYGIYKYIQRRVVKEDHPEG